MKVQYAIENLTYISLICSQQKLERSENFICCAKESVVVYSTSLGVTERMYHLLKIVAKMFPFCDSASPALATSLSFPFCCACEGSSNQPQGGTHYGKYCKS